MLSNISRFITTRPIKTVLFSLLVIALFVVGVRNVEMATGNETLVNTKTSVYQNNELYENEFGGESIIVLYEGNELSDLFSVETLENIKGLKQQLESQNSVYSIISPVTFVEQMARKQSEEYRKGVQEITNGLDKMGGQLREISNNLGTMQLYSDTLAPSLPTEQETLEYMVYEDGQLREIFDELVIDDKYMMMIITFSGMADDSDKSQIVSYIKDYLNNYPLDSLETIVSGKPVLDAAIRNSMQESMKKMMMLSIIFMIIVLSLVFKVQWRILPLATILIAVIGTVGLMGWLSIPITMVSMAVFPILIGLGIDYAIQFQNRYVEEMDEGGAKNEEKDF